MRLMLAPLSWCYRAGVNVRHFFYDAHILPTRVAKLPVVSIGNLVAGGAGKTQVALLLASSLEKSIPIAILSRGYRSTAESAKKPLIVDTKRDAPSECGDEPWLLASRLNAASIIVHKNRYMGSLVAEQTGAKLIILDDGMQHRALHRDMEIVVIDGETPLKHYLPTGPLRESPSQLKRADLIVILGTLTEGVQKILGRYCHAPLVKMKIVPTGIFDLQGASMPSLQKRKVALFCGIGNPKRFVKTVTHDLEAEVIGTQFVADHGSINENKMEKFALVMKKRGASFLICTEKDKIKLPPIKLSLPIIWVRSVLEVVEHHNVWQQALNKIKFLTEIPQ